jgi:large subunit ribosomal protein L7/L12
MTQHDGTLITPSVLSETVNDMQGQGLEKAHLLFTELEPHLSTFARENATHIAGKMALANVPRSVVRAVFNDIVGLVTLCFHAQRKGVHQLWQDTSIGEGLLARLGEAVQKTEATAAVQAQGGDGAAVVDVLLTNAGERKASVVRAIRRLTQQSLKEVRALAEATPSVLLRKVSREVAEQAKALVEKAGGSIVIL